MTISTIFTGVILLNASEKIEGHGQVYEAAMNRVKSGQTECYMYERRQMFRYTYQNGDSIEHKYYIDLKDFWVEVSKLSESWWQVEYAYAVIVELNGMDMFFMFNDLEITEHEI